MLRNAFAILTGLILCSQLALAQVTGGTITGVVKDESGAVIPAVSVAVKNLDTGMTREVTTDAQGRYRAPSLSLGNYEVQAGLSGFQTAVRTGVTLMVGQEAVIDFTLQVGEVTAKIEVTGEAPLVEPTRSDVSGVIDQKQVVDLPLNGRSFLQLAELQTGVVAARNATRTSPGLQQTVFTVSGSQSTSGLFLLDGTDIVDYLYASAPGGSSGLAIGVDLIREFRVFTNAFSAEYGRSSGGVVTVVTKSGTNRLQGTAFWFTRNDNLDARNFFDGVRKPEFKRNQFGGTLGGPIAKDKSFFLLSYEGLRERLGRSAVALIPNEQARQGILPASLGGNVGVAPNIKPFLDLYPLPNTGRDFGNGTAEWRGAASQPTDDDFFSVRLDHNFSEKDSLLGRYTFRTGSLADPFGSTPVPGFTSYGSSGSQFLTLQETRIFSPTFLNTLRAGFARSSPDSTLNEIPPELSISLVTNRGLGPITIGGLNQIGNRASRPSFARTTTYQLYDAVDMSRTRHSLKMGAEFLRYQINFEYRINFNGSYSFSTLRNFLTGTTNQYTGVLPGSDGYRGWRWSTYGFFVQDEWRLLSNFTLNLGLRYEPYGNTSEANGKMSALKDPLKDTAVQVVPTLFADNPSLRQFQPRVGFAWDPLRNGKLAIRGGFGVYYDRIASNGSYNGMNTMVPFATTIQINQPPFPRALAPGQTITPASVSLQGVVPYNGFKYPYSLQWNFTVQREIVPSTVASVTYAGSRGVHTQIQGNINLNRWEIRDGRKFFPAGAQSLNPAFANLIYKFPQGNSHFNSLQLSLRRRMSAGLQFQAAYTWSKSIDDGTTFGAAPVGNSASDVPDVFDTKLSRGLADLDVRHNFVFSSTYQLPFGKGNRWLGGWQMGGILTLASGIPFGQYVGFDRARSVARVGGSSAPDRVKPVEVFPRNADRYFDLTAFQLQPPGFFGNAGRNSVVGPGMVSVDFSVIKDIPITERVKTQWRLELFNLFNRANFGVPGDAAGGSSSGLTLFTDAGGVPVPTAGKLLRTVTSARQIQMGLKINF